MLKKATLSSCEAAAGFVPTRWYSENSGLAKKAATAAQAGQFQEDGRPRRRRMGIRRPPVGRRLLPRQAQRGHWRCCWSAPQSPALFHQGPEFGPQGFRVAASLDALAASYWGLSSRRRFSTCVKRSMG